MRQRGDFTRPTALWMARRLLAENPDVDGVFAACDLTASAMLQALTEYSGVQVPDDVALVGFDDSVIAASASVPLTSVRQPVELTAAAAAKALLQPGSRPAGRVRMPVRLVARDSTAVQDGGHHRDGQPGTRHRGPDQAGRGVAIPGGDDQARQVGAGGVAEVERGHRG